MLEVQQLDSQAIERKLLKQTLNQLRPFHQPIHCAVAQVQRKCSHFLFVIIIEIRCVLIQFKISNSMKQTYQEKAWLLPCRVDHMVQASLMVNVVNYPMLR